MLKVLRDNLKYLSWVLWLVIIVFILFVFVDFGSTVPGTGAPTEAAVTVGDREVTFAEFQNRYRQTEEAYREAYGEQFNAELAEQLRLPQQVLNQLVAEKVLLVEADRLGLAATDEEVRRRILSYQVFRNPDGSFIGAESYDRVLRSSGYTAEGFEDQVRKEILTEKLRTIVAQNVFVSAAEVEDSYRARTERAAIRFVRLGPERFGDQVTVSDEEIAAWYDANADELRRPEQRRVDYLLVDTAQVRDAIELSDAELRDYYDVHQEEFTQREQVRARHILLEVGAERSAEEARRELEAIQARIAAGEEFAAIARQVSEDEGTREAGGDLGFFGRGRMVEEFEQAAFDAAPGELVGPVETAFGLHLIEVTDRIEAGVRPFEEVRQAVHDRLLAERARTLTESKARELAERVESEGLAGAEGLQQLAAEDPTVVYAASQPFGRDDMVTGIGRATAFNAAAFGLSVDEISDPVQIPRGWAVLHLREVIEPRVPPLEEVTAEVRQAVSRDKSLALARERLAAARAELEAGADLAAVAEELGVEVQETAPFARGAAVGPLGRAPEVAAAAFDLDTGEVGGPLASGDGVVLFVVTERRRFDPDEFASAAAATREQLEGQRVSQLLASFIDRRRDQLEVRFSRALLENFELMGELGEAG